MFRKNKKYDIGFKESIVLKVIKGGSSCQGVAKEFSIEFSMVRRWVSFYRKYGLSGLKPIKNNYSPEFKQKVILEMRKKHLSLTAACVYFKIPSISTLINWIEVYGKEGLSGLTKERRGRPPSMPRKPKKFLTREEQLLEELADLRAENAYLKKLHALVQSEKEKGKKRRSSKN